MNIDVTEVKLEIYVPEEYIEPVRDALTHIGACRVGNYDHVMAFHCSRGSWRPLPGSSPFNGKTGEICFGTEMKMGVRCPVEIVETAVREVKKIHPYEEPVINVIPLLNIQC